LVQITNCTSPNCTDRPQVNIHCIENFFTVHDFSATCPCPDETEFALKIFTVLNILFTFRIFQQLALALKTEFALKIYTVLNTIFTLMIFERLVLALINRVCPELFPCIENTFHHSGFLSNLRLP